MPSRTFVRPRRTECYPTSIRLALRSAEVAAIVRLRPSCDSEMRPGTACDCAVNAAALVAVWLASHSFWLVAEARGIAADVGLLTDLNSKPDVASPSMHRLLVWAVFLHLEINTARRHPVPSRRRHLSVVHIICIELNWSWQTPSA